MSVPCKHLIQLNEAHLKESMFPKPQEKRTFIIAEVGQNHQGDPEEAKNYIKVFASLGADAIKFQTRNNRVLFSTEAYNKTYNSENAFSDIYGKHREILELPIESLGELKEQCHKYGVKFMSTPFDEPSLNLLNELKADILKIASFDLGNLPFINKIAKTQIPVVLSIGGGKSEQIKESVSEILKIHDQVSILHCVSEYPCHYSKLGLDNIQELINNFPELSIGLSDHFNGTLSGPVAYLKGARVFEKHVTFNRSWKGTDHSFALEPEGFRKFTRDIKRVDSMMMPKNSEELGKESVFKKLGKSIIASQDIAKGQIFSVDNLSGKIFNEVHTPVRESNKILGNKSDKDYKAGEPIQITNITSK